MPQFILRRSELKARSVQLSWVRFCRFVEALRVYSKCSQIRWTWVLQALVMEDEFVTDWLSNYPLALMMVMKSGLSDAPPTRKPSMSGCLASSLQLSADTEPVAAIHYYTLLLLHNTTTHRYYKLLLRQCRAALEFSSNCHLWHTKQHT